MLVGTKDGGRLVNLTCGDCVTYTVPQQIRLENMAKTCDVSFRVNRSFDDSRILVKDGDNVIAKFNRSHMAPGEMEHITLPRVLVEKAAGNELSISCETA